MNRKASSQNITYMKKQPRKAIMGNGMRSPKGMIEKGSSIQEQLLQPQYNQVVPTPAEVMAIINDIKPFQQQVDSRNFQFKPGRDERLPALKTALVNQCNSINALAMGSEDFIAFTGFEMSKVPELHPVPEEGVVKEITPLKDATAIFRFKGIRFRDFNEWEISGPGNYQRMEATKFLKAKVTHLPTGVNLKIRVRAVNGRGPGEWSESVSFIVYASTQSVGEEQAQ